MLASDTPAVLDVAVAGILQPRRSCVLDGPTARGQYKTNGLKDTATDLGDRPRD